MHVGIDFCRTFFFVLPMHHPITRNLIIKRGKSSVTDYLQQKSHMMMIKTVNWRSFCHVQMLQHSAGCMRADRGAVFGDDDA